MKGKNMVIATFDTSNYQPSNNMFDSMDWANDFLLSHIFKNNKGSHMLLEPEQNKVSPLFPMTDRVRQYKTTSGILFSESVAPSATFPVEVLILLDFAVPNMFDDSTFLDPTTNTYSKCSRNQNVA